jgi:transposase
MGFPKGVKPPRYDNDFKAGAVRLVVEQGRTRKEVAAELGICDDSLTNWLKQAGHMPKSIEVRNNDARRVKELEAQLRDARKQIAEKEEVITILKKSVGILSTP